MNRKLFQLAAMAMLAFAAVTMQANDGVYYVNGNQLVPVRETDIAVVKEVLSISLCDDGYASVDVQYEFMNRGKAKTVEMGFEAQAPYNAEETVNKAGKHPYISNFTATLNGKQMEYRNAIVVTPLDEECNFEPVDRNRYLLDKEGDWDAGCHLYDTKTNETVPFAYAYLFTANFKEGLNTVHHTYRYCMSFGVGRTFEVPYWLKPAMRWANRQIDDFTLRIKADGTAKHFIIEDSLFSSAPFKVVEGKGKIRKNNFGFDTTFTEVTLRNGVVEWHARNFKPVDDLDISSADIYTSFNEEYPFGYFYDRSKTYVPSWQEEKMDKRILRNLPYAHRGYMFKDDKLKAYFNKLWWYMPDPTWEASTDDFTPKEKKFINGDLE